jgi:hypothetical protein
LDKHAQVLAQLLLPDEFAEPLRAQSRFTGGVFCAACRVYYTGLSVALWHA